MFGSQFATPEVAVKAGFERVMAGVQAPEGVKLALYEEYAKAHTAGDPRAERKAVASALAGQDWQWPWFDQWLERFRAAEHWQELWWTIGECMDLLASQPPAGFDGALDQFSGKEMRAWAEERGIILPKARRNAELFAAFAATVPWDDFAPTALARHAEQMDGARDTITTEKRELLAQTLSMSVCRERDYQQWADGNRPAEITIVLSPEPDGDTADFLADLYATFNPRDRDTWPPYFPGDRTGTRVHNPRWYKD